ncbi:MAG TPA: hypothetical protein VHR45_10915 [Thermoanaerobaculia bacterium]|nr:hypothetical protein [Thermoanaerobaculia bacterium]
MAIEACRRGRWNEGLPRLARLIEEGGRSGTLPALAYSYLGYGIALRQKKVREGLQLCQHAVKLEFYQAESFLNLARTLQLAGQRRDAVRAVRAGLRLDRDNPQLLELQDKIGMRRRPVFSFLARSNPLNFLLGKLRHAVRPTRGGDPPG